ALVFSNEELSFPTRLANITAGRPARGVELMALRRNGSTVNVSVWNALVRDSNGNVTAVVEALADVTERLRLEERFRQAQKMEAVGRLAGGVAHDFNNMLTVITGYCQMILDNPAADASIRSDMQQVVRAADRATSLTRQLLAFSRRQMVQPKVLEADAVVLDMKAMLLRLLAESVRLELDLGAEGARIRMDPGNLEQVVINLAVNARDAMNNDGVLRIRTRKFIADDSATFPEGEYYLLEVTDNGTGMSEETLSHLFEPFFTTKERGHGTGLGLSTSYGIVKQNRGEIQVRSEVGNGSTFYIYLPLVNEPADVLPGTRETSRQYRGTECLLVTEDEDDVRRVVTGMLRTQGYRVLAASRGEEAIRIAAAEPAIDLLITDMVMPGMSGKELADRLRQIRPGLRVLFVSGYADTGIVQDGEVASDANFLQKPLRPEELAKKVREVLDAGVRSNA
ncbi:MAG TPA: ATP-binding protein, partial [Bryobacteraceae bacterium]|nr:ATP-binding protein [Bryobacteraceae bacterium]